jgi:hypothetical protein
VLDLAVGAAHHQLVLIAARRHLVELDGVLLAARGLATGATPLR